jgi:hypothetical protein
MSSKNIFIAISVIVLIALGIWLGSMFGPGTTKDSEFSAVYLTTGDIYFGKLAWFPKPHIENAWHLDRSVDADNKPQTSLVPVKNAVWGPSEDLYLNKDQIIFWSKLREDSPVAKAMRDPSSIEANQQTSATDTTEEPTP